MNDLEHQAAFVANAADRIISQIDPDPLSPTFGCAHLAFWRDKTSDLADMRRQEAMLPLALLFVRNYPGSRWQGEDRLLEAVHALISFWCRNQYPDGSLDEWYKGERALAAAAFSTLAAARTLEVAAQALPPETLDLARNGLARTAGWLTRRDDLFKANHQAVAAAALAFAGKILGDQTLTEAARGKLEALLKVQTPEGWFPEVGFMDLGYTFLTVEFGAMTLDLWQDWSRVEALRRAFDFASEWVHPDLTIGPEYGSCHNPYLSRIAAVLMAPHSGRAAWLRQQFETRPAGRLGLEATLSDDLRLLRWAWQPLVAYDYARRKPAPEPARPEPIPLADPDSGRRVWAQAGLARFTCGQGTGLLAAAPGGLVRFFGPQAGPSLTDLGYALRLDQGWAATWAYDSRNQIQETAQGLVVNCRLAPVKKFTVPFWARLALRLASTTAWGSKWTRRLIDFIRKRKGTAVNQSSASLSASRSPWRLSRQVSVGEQEVSLEDRLVFKRPIDRGALFFLKAEAQGWLKLAPVCDSLAGLPPRIERLTIVKTYRPGRAWELTGLKAGDEA
ncbi:MAG: hypothetical protein JRJ59_03485 [Deltaproteobacteria bacterium]|nr:hypothetical protein [Deltaproteobacteria bacterium]